MIMTDPALESTEPSGTGRSAYRDRTDPGVSGFLDEPLGLKVPLIGVSFWVVKVITTGMGEAMSDFLAKFSIALPVLVGVIAVAVAMVRQLRARRYHAPTYWSAVAAIAIFGTVGADGLHAVGVSTTVTSLFYAVVLGVWMVLWYRSEGTLSIHDITTRRRELFYWGTVLLTFALGTALGDWSAFFLGLGFGGSIVLYAALIVVPGVAWKFLRLNSIVAFWAAYILTRPLGASIADWLGKPSPVGIGWGDGVVALGSVALAAILVLVLWRTRRDDPNRPVLRTGGDR
ncbi:COG4705 family protein [Gordonia polyisoprenivorans]|uniref:Membrane-anchored protein n=1 Tax=Gordonia polyisoprenivorans TaxID=84595 RepID=A0A846WLZ3_9ACTN|nr:membrane protein [Gordonia polyisoprenivorans]NKY01823.1 hypothetical protein [Gordonia polyisoprenivorans]QUD83320.1 hypothetical protein J8M97_01130 [Gordonia polyisoprenivorans]